MTYQSFYEGKEGTKPNPSKIHHPISISDKPWRDKAEKIIGRLCEVSYRQANYKNGKKYVKHRPYAVPFWAEQLISCLGTNDEPMAKAIFERLAYLNEVGANDL